MHFKGGWKNPGTTVTKILATVGSSCGDLWSVALLVPCSTSAYSSCIRLSSKSGDFAVDSHKACTIPTFYFAYCIRRRFFVHMTRYRKFSLKQRADRRNPYAIIRTNHQNRFWLNITLNEHCRRSVTGTCHLAKLAIKHNVS